MSVRQLNINKITKDGRSWVFYLNEYGLDGKRHQYQSPAYFTKDEAIDAEKKYLDKFKYIECSPNITFKEAYLKFYEYKEDKVKKSTLKTYKDRMKYMGLLNNVKLIDMDGNLYQKWRTKMNELSLTDTYKNDVQKFIKMVCNFAEKEWDFNLRKFYNKLVPFREPGKLPKEKQFYTPNEFSKFVSVIDDLRYKCFFKTLYYCGLRRSEARDRKSVV